MFGALRACFLDLLVDVSFHVRCLEEREGEKRGGGGFIAIGCESGADLLTEPSLPRIR